MTDIKALQESFVIADTFEKALQLSRNGYKHILATNISGEPVSVLVLEHLVEDDYLAKTTEFSKWYLETFAPEEKTFLEPPAAGPSIAL